MGQALRRATARVRSSAHEPPPRPPKNPEPPAGAQDRLRISDAEDISKIKGDNSVLEERDPQYDAMLNKVVGAITSKPGGRLETGEAFIVEKYNRPMPKLRTSKADPSGDGQKPVPPGTLTIVQLQQIILLYQGKSNEHKGPMEIGGIAKKFGIDAAQVERIVQSVSLLPEDHKKNNQQQQ